MDLLLHLWHLTGFPHLTWQMPVMWTVVGLLFYLAIYRGFEPLLLVPIAFGALLANLPTRGLTSMPPGELLAPASGLVKEVRVSKGQEVKADTLLIQIQSDTGKSRPPETISLRAPVHGRMVAVNCQPGDYVLEGAVLGRLHSGEPGGLFHYIYKGIEWEIFPPLIFLGVGALTDFGPVIANPRTLLLGAAAQLGVLVTFLGALALGFSHGQSAAVSIIGGADGPTAIFLASSLAPELLSPIAVAAYTYMALVPLIQPPIMRALTTPAERRIRMQALRPVSRPEKLTFALLVTISCILLVPAASALIGMLMLGNFLRESAVTERLVKAAQNEIINVVTIFLGTSVGITMTGERFLQPGTLKIIALGVLAFAISTAGGVLMAKLINLIGPRHPINPLIGAAGVSAVPMAARVAHLEGQRADPQNYLLMHAMGPNVAGVIGTAVVAGYYLATLGK